MLVKLQPVGLGINVNCLLGIASEYIWRVGRLSWHCGI